MTHDDSNGPRIINIETIVAILEHFKVLQFYEQRAFLYFESLAWNADFVSPTKEATNVPFFFSQSTIACLRELYNVLTPEDPLGEGNPGSRIEDP